MRVDTFNDIVREQIGDCERMLIRKADEYADDSDRMHNFKVAAKMTGEHPVQALGGMMVKHTVSIYDLIRDIEQSEFDLGLWEEKITDHINYLLLLRALIIEDHIFATVDYPVEKSIQGETHVR